MQARLPIPDRTHAALGRFVDSLRVQVGNVLFTCEDESIRRFAVEEIERELLDELAAVRSLKRGAQP